MKLTALGDHVFCIKGYVNIGVITNQDREALLVDAGIDSRWALRVQQLLAENRLRLKGAVITHAHADHFGGAHCLSAMGVRIYAGVAEQSVITNPVLEAQGMFGGAYPPAALRCRRFFAEPAVVHAVLVPGETHIAGMPLEIVDLGGHTTGQIGVASGNTLFCADALFMPEQLRTQPLLKHADVAAALQTLARLKSRGERVFVPAHGDILAEVGSLATANAEKLERTLAAILHLAERPVSAETLLAMLCEEQSVSIKDVPQYCVLHLGLQAHLGRLLDSGRLTGVLCGNRLMYQKIKQDEGACSRC